MISLSSPRRKFGVKHVTRRLGALLLFLILAGCQSIETRTGVTENQWFSVETTFLFLFSTQTVLYCPPKGRQCIDATGAIRRAVSARTNTVEKQRQAPQKLEKTGQKRPNIDGLDALLQDCKCEESEKLIRSILNTPESFSEEERKYALEKYRAHCSIGGSCTQE